MVTKLGGACLENRDAASGRLKGPPHESRQGFENLAKRASLENELSDFLLSSEQDLEWGFRRWVLRRSALLQTARKLGEAFGSHNALYQTHELCTLIQGWRDA
jgi:hypothetical protein